MAVQGPHTVIDPMSKLSVSTLSLTPSSRRSIGLPSTPTAEISSPWPDHASSRVCRSAPRKLSSLYGDTFQEPRTQASTPTTEGVSPRLWKMVVLSARRSPTSVDKGIKNLHLRDLSNITRTKLFATDQNMDLPLSCSGSTAGCRAVDGMPAECTSVIRRCRGSPQSSPDSKMSVKRRRLGAPSAVSTQLFADTSTSSMVEQMSVRLRTVPAESDRYEREFEVREQLGCGEFGAVYKCQNLVDGALYAVKRSHQAVDAHIDEASLREAHTHGMLDSHPHIVRYYSAWLEERHLFMQFEYCSGGSLLDEMARHTHGLSDADVRNLLVQVGAGLQHIHANQLAHLDIKPGNIFLCRQRTSTGRAPDSETLSLSPGNGCHCCKTPPGQSLIGGDPCVRWIYKIGDFGHAVRLDLPELSLDVDEGDCRYLSREVLEGNFADLPKADVFALALTAYEALGGGPLPKNGPEWHCIREGQLTALTTASKELHQLLISMICADFHSRPSATELTASTVLSPTTSPSYDQLRMQLDKERSINEKLKRQLAEMQKEGPINPGWNMTLRPLEGKSRLRTAPGRRPVHSSRPFCRSQSVN